MLKLIRRIKEAYGDLNVVIKATIWFTCVNFFIRGLGLITVPLFTRLLPMDQYGDLTLFYSSVSILLIFSSWDLQYGAYQKGLFKYSDDIDAFTSSTTLFCSLSTVIVLLVLFIFKDFFSRFLWIPDELFFVMALYVFCRPAYSNWAVLKQKDYQYKPVTIVTLLVSVCSVIASVLSVLLIKRTGSVKVTAEYAVHICAYLPIFLLSLHIRSLKNNLAQIKEHWKFIVCFQAPCVLHSLSLILLGQADRIMIGKYISSASAALYGVAYNFSNVIIIFQNSLEQAVLPWRYRKLQAKQYDEVGNISNLILLVIGFIVEGFVLVAPEVFKLLLTREYYESVWCVPPIALSVLYIYMYTLFTSVEAHFEKTQYIMYTSVTCTILNIIMNYFAIKYIGYVACGYTTLISYMFFALLHYMFMRKVLRTFAPGESVFNMKGMLGIVFSMTAIVMGTTLLYEHMIIRYVALALLAIGLLIYRKKIIPLFKFMLRETRSRF